MWISFPIDKKGKASMMINAVIHRYLFNTHEDACNKSGARYISNANLTATWRCWISYCMWNMKTIRTYPDILLILVPVDHCCQSAFFISINSYPAWILEWDGEVAGVTGLTTSKIFFYPFIRHTHKRCRINMIRFESEKGSEKVWCRHIYLRNLCTIRYYFNSLAFSPQEPNASHTARPLNI